MNSVLASVRYPRPATPGGRPLRRGDIAVWRAALDAHPDDVVAGLESLLSADEAARAGRFYFERDRRRFVVGRGILRTILGEYLALAPRELVFEYGPNDKPSLAAWQAGAPPLAFNVAHSEGLALIAVTRAGDVGIDLERIRPVPEWEQIAESSFSPSELARIQAAPAGDRIEEFFRAWTRQEAVLKALGVGLNGVGGRRESGPAGPADEPGADRNAFVVHPVNPGHGYVGALAATRDGRWTTCLTWPEREPLAWSSFPRRPRRVPLQNHPRHGAYFP
jgi:4'-phosphopantetheinyl transferase